MTEIFEDSDYYTGPSIDLAQIRLAESDLDVRLPAGYVDLLIQRNGGTPRRCCCPTTFPTSWADDHFEISGIRGIGGEWGIDRSECLISEWNYPKIGIVICDTPSAGHDTVMLDYSKCGSTGEPTVAYIDEDRIPRQVADSFDDFIGRLVQCENSLE